MNITEYASRFGDRELRTVTISDIWVLTALSYLPLAGIVSERFDEAMPLGYALGAVYVGSLFPHDYDGLVEAILKGKRFSTLMVCGARRNSDGLEKARQFAALTIRLSECRWLISYSGTDGTLAGWKENFQFSYQDQTPAQRDAKDYLEDAACNLKGRFQITGHSKGGNLAVYAAGCTMPEVRSRIDSIFCNDGPGFNWESSLTDSAGFHEAGQKLVCWRPQSSIVGQLLATPCARDVRIVRSNSHKGRLYEHDIYNWQLNESGFPDEVDSNPAIDKLMVRTNELIHAIAPEKRNALTDFLFSELSNGGRLYVDGIIRKLNRRCPPKT